MNYFRNTILHLPFFVKKGRRKDGPGWSSLNRFSQLECLEPRRLLAAQALTPGEVSIQEGTAAFDPNYNVVSDDGTALPNEKVSSFALHLHYDSSKITPNVDAFRASDFNGGTFQDATETSEDEVDSDETDRFVRVLYLDFASPPAFPRDQTLPIALTRATFDAVGDFDGATNVRFVVAFPTVQDDDTDFDVQTTAETTTAQFDVFGSRANPADPSDFRWSGCRKGVDEATDCSINFSRA